MLELGSVLGAIPKAFQTDENEFKLFFLIFGPQAPGLVPLDLGRDFTQNSGVNASGTVIWSQFGP